MRPIIEYHGPLFQLLSRLVMRVGHDNALLIWQAGAVIWLLSLAVLALTKRYSGWFTALALLGVGLLRVPGLGLVEQNVDESQWIVSAATLVADPYFWRSVDGTTSGPLNVWLPALVYYLGFSLDYTTLRGWGLLTCVLPTVWLLLTTFRHQLGERVARLAIIPVATCLALTTDPDGVAFNSEQLPMLLLALTGYLLSRIFTRNPAVYPPLGGLLELGFVLGCLPYTKLQATLAGLFIAGWVLIRLFREIRPVPARFRRMSLFVMGGLLPTAFVGLYLLATGLTDYAFRSYVLTNLDYAQAGSWGVGALGWADRLTVRLPQIYGGMPTTGWFWGLALLLVLVWPITALFRPASDSRATGRMGFVVSVCLVSLYATLQPGNPFPHYQWLSFVPVSWLIGELVRLLTRKQPPVSARPQPLPNWWARSLTAVYLVVSVGYPGWLMVSRPNPGVAQLAAGGWQSSMAPVSGVIRQYARPNDKLVIWGWANSLHVDTGLLMGTRCIPLYFPVVPGPQQAYFLDVYRRDILRNRPAVIVDAVGLHPGRAYDRYPIRRYPAIQAILDRHYRLEAIVQGAKVYALKR